MNTIVLKNSIDYHQYQQIVDFFATIGVEIENPYGEGTLQDDEVLLQALDEGITQADKGLLIPHNEVMQEIDLLLTTMYRRLANAHTKQNFFITFFIFFLQ
jgi:hypothetical protein